MSPPNPTRLARLLLAGVTAPIVGILSLIPLLMLWARVPPQDILGDALSAAGFLLGFGALGAYTLEVWIGIPAYRWLKRTGRLRLSSVTATAAFAGSLAFAGPLFLASDTPTLGYVALILVLGAVGGAVAGAWFWLVAFGKVRRSNQRMDQPSVYAAKEVID